MNTGYLVARAGIVAAIRRFFDMRDFIEVETAVRIAAPAPEEHIDCPPCRDGGFLRASPELQMKKLLAEGLDRIYQIGPCFREGERGTRHNPEFTMIEWYRRDADYRDIAKDLTELWCELMRCSCYATMSCRRRPQSDPERAIRWLPVRDAYREYAGWDPFANFDQDRFDFDMATKIEPALKAARGGVFLADYPPQAASLAKLAVGEDGCEHAERWEFYWNGMELANCFTELCDAEEQRRRFVKARNARAGLGESDYPIDEEFLSALHLIGSASGVALGVDRLVMVLTGASDIASVRAPV